MRWQRLCVLFIFYLTLESGTCFTLPNNGTQTRAAIVGGEFWKIFDAPYHVQLIAGSYVCGGALISTRHVLTAAHCVQAAFNRGYDITVLAGSGTLYKSEQSRATVEYTMYNGGVDMMNLEDVDIAILTVDTPFTLNKYIGIIGLPSHRPILGEYLSVTGFGYFDQTLRVPSRYFKRFRSTLIDCKLYLPFTTDLCLKTEEGQGACYGDSGSPLIDSEGNVVGVYSRIYSTETGCAGGPPDIFASVYDKLDWIYQHTGIIPQKVPKKNKFMQGYYNSQMLNNV